MTLTLDQCFDAAAPQHAKKTAVVYDDGAFEGSLSYLEVSRLAGELAAKIRQYGTEAHCTVACLCTQSLHVVPIILGVLKAGRSFAFLDLENVQRSIRALQKSTSTALLVAEKLIYAQSPLADSGEWELVEDFWDGFQLLANTRRNETSRDDVQGATSGAQIAYVMWTSGSTGEPKTVKVPHACIVPNVLHLRTIFNISSEDVIFASSPLTFDSIVVQMFMALSTGATLLVTSEHLRRIPGRTTAHVLSRNGVTVLQGTTSFFVRLGAALVKESLLSRDTRLRVVAFGGEDCPSVAMLKRWSGIGNATEFYNLYGTTEVSCWSTCHRIDLATTTRDAKYVPLGDPLDATVLEVRNELGEVIREGDGLLFIGGLNKQCLVGNETWDQVGPSYLRNSGDLVHASGGVLTFLGRRDSNFKYNNRLVHCALLTKTLLSSGPVETCHSHYSKPEKMLFLFVTLAQDCAPEEAMPPLRSSIEPHCECPFQIVPVRTLPLNCHGKVDVQALLYQSKKEGLLDYGFAYRQHLSKLWKKWAPQNGSEGSIIGKSRFLLCGGTMRGIEALCQDMEFATNCSLPLLAHKVLGGTFEDVAAYVDKAIRRAPEVIG